MNRVGITGFGVVSPIGVTSAASFRHTARPMSPLPPISAHAGAHAPERMADGLGTGRTSCRTWARIRWICLT